MCSGTTDFLLFCVIACELGGIQTTPFLSTKPQINRPLNPHRVSLEDTIYPTGRKTVKLPHRINSKYSMCLCMNPGTLVKATGFKLALYIQDKKAQALYSCHICSPTVDYY